MPAYAIEVEDVRKTFRLPHERHTTLAERMLHFFRTMSYERLEALRGVSLRVEEGKFVGLIGRNGSGKSTLLKIIAGVLVGDSGRVTVRGSASPLLELGLGFHQELTVRENVEVYATILGCKRRELQARVTRAIEFAELERFEDAKLKNLSTGMRMRLAFATALQAHSEIFLLDEILAVGDEIFQRKCFDAFDELKKQGRTIVLVSHKMEHVERFCDSAVYLEQGRIVTEGPPRAVIERYLADVQAARVARETEKKKEATAAP